MKPSSRSPTTTTTTAAYNTCSSSPFAVVVAVVLAQWLLISYLLLVSSSSHSGSGGSVALLRDEPSSLQVPQQRAFNDVNITHNNNTNVDNGEEIEGVFATVIMKAPKWFHVRYTLMLHNAISNMPSSTTSTTSKEWILQIFINEKWVNETLVPYHPGFVRLLERGASASTGDSSRRFLPRIVVTPLPERLVQGKPKLVYVDRWFWESMAADRVVLFSGNGAFCANHKTTSSSTTKDSTANSGNGGGNDNDGGIAQLASEVDFCGVPGGRNDLPGGDGSTHSIRNRKAMLRVVDYMRQHNLELGGKSEAHFVAGLMNKMNAANIAGGAAFRLATPEQTRRFGGVTNVTVYENGVGTSDPSTLRHLPMVVSGTSPKLSFEERDELLKHCPELKTIFPSMHEPACFGAHPDPVKCKASICALQENRKPGGC